MPDSDPSKRYNKENYKRRSSILKGAKTEEEPILQPLGTRRVSFADTHEVQEFLLYDSSRTDSLQGSAMFGIEQLGPEGYSNYAKPLEMETYNCKKHTQHQSENVTVSLKDIDRSLVMRDLPKNNLRPETEIHYEQNGASGSLEMSLTMTLDNKIVCTKEAIPFQPQNLPNNNQLLNTMKQCDDYNVGDMELSLLSTVNKLIAQDAGRGKKFKIDNRPAIRKEPEEMFDAVKRITDSQDIVEDMQITYEPVFNDNIERSHKENVSLLKRNLNVSEGGNTSFNHTQYAMGDMSLTNVGFNRTVDPLCIKDNTSSRTIFKQMNLDNLNKEVLTSALPSSSLNRTRYTSDDMSLTLAINKTINCRVKEQASIPVILEPTVNNSMPTSKGKLEFQNLEQNLSLNADDNLCQIDDNKELMENVSDDFFTPQLFDKENVSLPYNLPSSISTLKSNEFNINTETNLSPPQKPSAVNVMKSQPVLKDLQKTTNIFSSQRVKNMNIIKPGSRFGFIQQGLIVEKSLGKAPCDKKAPVDDLLSPLETVRDEVNMPTENPLNIVNKSNVQPKLAEPKFSMTQHSRIDVTKKLDILLKNRQDRVEPKIFLNDGFSSPIMKIRILSDGNELMNHNSSKQSSEIPSSDLPPEERLLEVSMPHCPNICTQQKLDDQMVSHNKSHLVSHNSTSNLVPDAIANEKECEEVEDSPEKACQLKPTLSLTSTEETFRDIPECSIADNLNQLVVSSVEIQVKEMNESLIIRSLKNVESAVNQINSPKVHSIQEIEIPVEEHSLLSVSVKEDDVELLSEMDCAFGTSNENLLDFDTSLRSQKMADVSDISIIGFMPPSSSTVRFESVDLKLCAEDMFKKMKTFRNISRKYFNNEIIELGFMDDKLLVHLSFASVNGIINYNSLISDVRMAPIRKDLQDPEKVSYFITQCEIGKYQVKKKIYKLCDLPECLMDIHNMTFFAKEFMTDYANMDFHHNNISIEFKDNYALLTTDMHSLFWRLIFDAQYKVQFNNYLREPILPTFIEKTGVISDKFRSNLVDHMIKVPLGSNYFYRLSEAIKNYMRDNPVYNKPPPNKEYLSWIY